MASTRLYFMHTSSSLTLKLDGIPCVDGTTGSTFTLRAHILSWSGDIPALTKVMCTTGHNSYKACRFCFIQGIYSETNRHIYFPLKPPTGMSGISYDPKSLPLRTHRDYVRGVAAVKHSSGTSLARKVREHGKARASCVEVEHDIDSPTCLSIYRREWREYFVQT